MSPNEEKETRLSILQEVVSFCEQRGITCTLAWGSLLGAVREGGIIPWDYDIDVMMPRPDYERFVREYPQNSRRKYTLFDSRIQKNYHARLGVVADTGTRCANIGVGAYHPLFHLNIEIYPADGIPHNPLARQFLLTVMNVMNEINKVKLFYWDRSRAAWKNIVLLVFSKLLLAVPENKVINLLIKNIQYENSNEISFLYIGKFEQKIILPKDFFDDIHYVSFDGVRCLIPDDYDMILTLCYGDYMTLPDKSEIDRSIKLRDMCEYERE